MGRMAGQTAFFAIQRFMGELNLLLGVLVTGKTETVAPGKEQFRVIRCVDIVARKAVSAFKWFMLQGATSHQ